MYKNESYLKISLSLFLSFLVQAREEVESLEVFVQSFDMVILRIKLIYFLKK